MANALFDSGRQKFLEGGIPWLSGNIKCALVRSSTYTPNLATHTNITDVTAGGSVVATSANFTTKTSTAGVADADDIVFTSVAAGAAIQYIVIYLDSGTPSTSWLIALLDSGGLPVTPNGGNITVTWDSGTSRIFKL